MYCLGLADVSIRTGRATWTDLIGYNFKKAYQKLEENSLTAHTSGHIYIEDIIDLVGAIKPKQIVPIHTLSLPGSVIILVMFEYFVMAKQFKSNRA